MKLKIVQSMRRACTGEILFINIGKLEAVKKKKIVSFVSLAGRGAVSVFYYFFFYTRGVFRRLAPSVRHRVPPSSNTVNYPPPPPPPITCPRS